MKKNILTILIIFVSLGYCQATQWTVSADPNRPAQFTTLIGGYNAASPGDTILLAGFSGAYGSIEIYKPIVILGEGAHNPDGYTTRISGLILRNHIDSLGASGSQFIGLYFYGYIQLYGDFTGQVTGVDNKLENINFIRCEWDDPTHNYTSNGVIKFYTGDFNNFHFVHCKFSFKENKPHGYTSYYGHNPPIHFNSGGTYTNILIENCINPRITGITSNSFNGELLVKNSIYLNFTFDAFLNADSVHFENCIFYKAEPTGATNSVFSNCITYICNNNTLPYGTNSGSGNQININPLFIDYPPLAAYFEWNHDYGLQTGSPASGAGTGGTNIGLTGGAYPVNNIPGHSHTPVVTEVSMPNSSVPLNGTLQGNIKAKVRN